MATRPSILIPRQQQPDELTSILSQPAYQDPRLQTLVQPSGHEGTLGSILHIANEFSKGASQGRMQTFLQKEMRKDRAFNSLVNYGQGLLQDPDLTPEARQGILNQMNSLYAQRFSEDLRTAPKTEGFGGQIRSVFQTLFTGLMGGELPKGTKPIDTEAARLQLEEFAGKPENRQSTYVGQINEAFNKDLTGFMQRNNVTDPKLLATQDAVRIAGPYYQQLLTRAPERAEGWLRLNMSGFGADVIDTLKRRYLGGGAPSAPAPQQGAVPQGMPAPAPSVGDTAVPAPAAAGSAPSAPPVPSGMERLGEMAIFKELGVEMKPYDIFKPGDPTQVRQAVDDPLQGRRVDPATRQPLPDEMQNWARRPVASQARWERAGIVKGDDGKWHYKFVDLNSKQTFIDQSEAYVRPPSASEKEPPALRRLNEQEDTYQNTLNRLELEKARAMQELQMQANQNPLLKQLPEIKNMPVPKQYEGWTLSTERLADGYMHRVFTNPKDPKDRKADPQPLLTPLQQQERATTEMYENLKLGATGMHSNRLRQIMGMTKRSPFTPSEVQHIRR